MCLNPTRKRPANVLVLFALLLFVLFAFAALTIDTAFALLARREMQTAADTAALEGLRFRDTPPPFLASTDPVDAQRRNAAVALASAVFADSLVNPDGQPVQLGAGPNLTFSGGIALPGTTFEAAQTVTPATSPVFVPQLRPNLANAPAGDMVSGTFLPAYPPVEDSAYDRNDFTPAAGSSSDSFLVRLRRTNETFDPASETSSGGPPLPYLFGRATLMNPDAKARGISVRATAIAQGQPAMAVGVPNASLKLPGMTPFSLKATFWAGITSPQTITADNGLVVRDPKNNIVGSVIALSPLALGQIPAAGDLASYQTFLPQGNYVPIVADSGVLAGRVLGFGHVTVTVAGGNPLQATIVVQANQIASMNASAVLTTPLDADAASNVELLMQSHFSLTAPLLAPALVR